MKKTGILDRFFETQHRKLEKRLHQALHFVRRDAESPSPQNQDPAAPENRDPKPLPAYHVKD